VCGLVLLHGEGAPLKIHYALQRIEHRGLDGNRVYSLDHLSLGFCRLAINDNRVQGMQPFKYLDLICMINGEIFNSEKLKEAHDIKDLLSHSDCEVVAPLFSLYGVEAIEYLDGFFAGIIINTKNGKVFTIRDRLGKKPLFFGVSKGLTFLVSELKALEYVDKYVEIPSGVTEVDFENFILIQKYVYPRSLKGTVQRPISYVLNKSVCKRLPKHDQPCAIFLSGGLDSSIIASIASKHHTDITYLCLADSHSDDFKYVKRLVEHLSLERVQYIPLPDEEELFRLIESVVTTSDSFNPSIISNGIGTYILSEIAHQMGIKVVLSGEGADELFGGYFKFYKKNEEGDFLKKRNRLIHDMKFTELRRIDLCGMAHGIEIRCPFLDSSLLDFAMHCGVNECYGYLNNKKINKKNLRQAFETLLPEEIILRQKVSFDVGSGLRGKVRRALKSIFPNYSERDALKSLWRRQSNYPHLVDEPYFSKYPVFDAMIDQRSDKHI